MRINRKKTVYEGSVSPWLEIRVHLDALRSAPLAYLRATWWRLMGKRLRARSQFAPMLGASPNAYRLWMQKRETGRILVKVDEPDPPIVALVDARLGHTGLDDTMRSLEIEGLPSLIVGANGICDPAALASNIPLEKNPWLMPIACGDLLARGASNSYRGAIAGSEAHLAYADDDLLDDAGQRIAPHFKPGWNSELFRHFDYVTGSCVLRTSAEDLAGLSGNGWMRQLTLLAAKVGTPVHVPQLLHHRRSRPHPQVPMTPETSGQVLPSVSVIVPTRNRLELLRACLEGLERTDYPHLEVLVVDNDSDDPATLAHLDGLKQKGYRVLHHPGKFNFSAINNSAAAQAGGEILCLLNNDVEVIEPNWLRTMVTQALRDDVGAVGAMLLYADGRIQHAGVVLGVCGAAAHAHRFLRPDEEGYFQRHLLPQFESAVTAACMVVRRDRFLAVGGFDEHNFAVAFNDVDICMRLNERGWQSLYEPRARLIHHESVSRGKDRKGADAERFATELAALKKLWSTDRLVDPFHHSELSPFSEQFVVAV